MISALVFFVSLGAWAKDSTCANFEIKIPAHLRVAEEPHVEPVWHELSYAFEFCDDEDRVFLVERGLSASPRRTLAFSGGFIEKIYQPSNLSDEVFKSVPVRTEVISRRDYKMTDDPNRYPMGEFRFYAKDRLQSHSARRSRAPEWTESRTFQQRLQPFAPFQPLLISAPVPENAGVDLAWNHFSFSRQGPTYALWSLRTVGGFEMTYLIEVERAIAVPLVEAYLGLPDGKLLLDEPAPEFRMFNFYQLGRVVQLDHLAQEEQMPPVSYQQWRDLQDSRARSKQAQYLAARFGTRAINESEARYRKLFTGPTDRELILEEWFELFQAEDLHELFLDQKHARTLALSLSKTMLLREFPELKFLKNRESIEAFAEASADLLLARVLKSADLRAAIETHLETLPENPVSEASCHELLLSVAERSGRELNHEIFRQLRKASFNLSVLRTVLEKFRGN